MSARGGQARRYDNSSGYEAEVIDYRTLKRRKLKATKVKDANFVLQFAVSVTLILAIMIGNITMIGVTKQYQEEIHTINQDIKSTQEKNIALQSNITESVNIAQIEKIAKEKLGMNTPEPYQVIYVDVPKESYTVSYEKPKAEKKSFKSLLGIFAKD